MYFYRKNHKCKKVITCEDLSKIKNKRPDFSDKTKFKDWQSDVNTDHVFYSLCEGDSPSERITEAHNPIRVVHGLAVDYDAPVDWNIVDEVINTASKKYSAPTYISKTFSNYIRTIYEFKEPILIESQLYPAFIKELGVRLNVERLFNGFDPATYVAGQYFELGTDWRKVGSPLDTSVVHPAWIKAAGSVDYKGADDMDLEIVHKALQEKYGNRWVGEFKVGARGPILWVDDDVDREGCMVKENGFWVFSTRSPHTGFLPYEDLLGKDFARKCEEEKYGQLLDSYWYDGKTFYSLDEDGIVVDQKDSVLKLDLRSKGFSKTSKRNQMTDLEKAELYISQKSRVHLVAPVPSRKERVVHYQSHKILNTDTLKVMQPAPERDPDKCAWLQDFIDQLFTDGLDYFYAWWQRAYIAALEKKPLQGQCLIIVGGAGKGKSLLSNRIIGGSMGGFADAAAYVSGVTTFNKELGSKLLWVVDDNTSAANPQDQRRATEINKRIVANPRCEFIAKGRDGVTVPWTGRVVITTNLDAHSLSVIRTLDSSNEDKIMALLVDDKATTKFPPNAELEAKIEEQLPYLLAELLELKLQDRLKGDQRYGVKGFVNETVREAAFDNSSRSTAAEFIDFFATRTRAIEGDDSNGFWEGTITELQSQAMALNENRHIGISANLEYLRKSFHSYEEACKINSTMRPIRSRGAGGGKRWTIDLDARYDLSNAFESSEEPF